MLRGGAAGLRRSPWPGFSAALPSGQLLASSCALLSPPARTLGWIFPKRRALFTPFVASATSASSKLRDSNFWGNQENGEAPPSLRYLGLRAWRRGTPSLVGTRVPRALAHGVLCTHLQQSEGVGKCLPGQKGILPSRGRSRGSVRSRAGRCGTRQGAASRRAALSPASLLRLYQKRAAFPYYLKEQGEERKRKSLYSSPDASSSRR